jgi:hypothetical protein
MCTFVSLLALLGVCYIIAKLFLDKKRDGD